MTSLLVVGGTSFIATHALPRLVAGGARVHATVRDPRQTPAVAGVRWVPGDLTAADPTAGWPAACDAVLYLAQSRAWRRFPEGAVDVFDVNVRGVFHAAEYARRAGAAHFIFASTGSIYAPGTQPAREHDPIDVTDVRHFYVAAKLSAELMLGAYTPEIQMTILRLFVPYGPGQATDMLMPQLVRKVRDGVPILLDGDDGLKMNPVAIADVVDAIDRCLQLTESATLNVAGPEVLSLREIGQRIGRLLGREPCFERRAGVERSIVGDTSALRLALGWAPSTLLVEGLRGCAAE